MLLTAVTPAIGASTDSLNFDHQGKKRFSAYQVTPEVYLQADSGDRNLQSFYDLRQYPGSPPRIPHEVDLTIGPGATDCISCHGKGGFSPEFGKFIPVTPHPENILCYQCHVPVSDGQPFVANSWQSIEPPRLGRSFLPGAPPPVPHNLQLRENCVACHTGPGAVTEIRVSHVARGDCRQCHVPAVQSEPMVEFRRE
jgi:cytochrome c-type protein NapB